MTTPTRPPIHAKRIGPTLVPDRSRVLMRPFYPTTDDIARRIVARVMALPDEEVARLLSQVLGEFADRHEHVEKFFRKPLRAGASFTWARRGSLRRNGRRSSALTSRTNIRRNPRRCSIRPSCRTPTKAGCPRARCVSS